MEEARLSTMELCAFTCLPFTFYLEVTMHDKNFWHAILKNDGEIPVGEALDALTAELLDFMRSPDPELRDTFGYQLLTHYTMSGAYSEDALREFMERWLSDLNTGL